MMTLAFKGYDRYINNGSDDFKPELTNDGQKAGVYSHLIGMAGSILAGPIGTWAGLNSALYDQYEKLKGDAQAPAETAGNDAGIKAGFIMADYIDNRKQDRHLLFDDLRALLCE